jgi:hypothetical protein
MRYAQDTSVSVERSKADIERLLVRYGATQFANGWDGNMAMLAFHIADRSIRFLLPLPPKDGPQFVKTPGGKRTRSPEDRERAWEQACRSRWRALLLVIKAKLEAASVGISTIEDEFMAWTVVPGSRGKTIGEIVRPQLAEAAASHKPARLLLGEGTDG